VQTNGSSSVSENSLAGIQLAEIFQIPYVEIDVRASLDGELFLYHDRRLHTDRIQNLGEHAELPLNSLTSTQLKGLRLINGEEIPTLADGLTVIDKLPSSITVHLDLKSEQIPFMQKVLAELQKFQNATQKIMIQCESFVCLEFWTKSAPEIRILARVHDPTELEERLRFHPAFVQMDADDLTKCLVASAHSNGAKLSVKTLGDLPENEESWRMLCEWGVDMILTDRPVEVRKFIAASKPPVAQM